MDAEIGIGLMTAGAAILVIVVTNWASTLGARVARILEILEKGDKEMDAMAREGRENG